MEAFDQSLRYKSSNFDWGGQNEGTKEMICQEVFINRVYERMRPIKLKDMVLDVGANVGAFSYSILHSSYDKQPCHVICLEPSTELIKTLRKNLLHTSSDIMNYAIASSTGSVQAMTGSTVFMQKSGYYDTISFADLVHFYQIQRINFLKTDCEGGEYDLFSPQNHSLVKKVVEYVAGEFHLGLSNDYLKKFIEFRDRYINGSFRAFSGYHSDIDEDITGKIKSNDYLEKYVADHGTASQIMLYFYP